MQEDDSVATNSKPITLEDCWSVIAKLTEEISRLKEQLNTNSTNSSLPPSKDFKNPKRTKTKKASVRKRGDQSGHKGHARKLFESSQADEIIKCVWSCPLKQIGRAHV